MQYPELQCCAAVRAATVPEENFAFVDVVLAKLEYLKTKRGCNVLYRVLFLTNRMTALSEQSALS